MKLNKQLVILLNLLIFTFSVHVAGEDYSAEGERRAKSAGQSLIGTAAPQTSMVTIDGATIDLSKVYGTKPVYIKFWATWCVPCRQQMQGFEEIYQKYGESVQVIAVNIGIGDNVKSVTAFRNKMKLTMPVVIDDGSLARAFKLRVTPQHLLVDRNGNFSYFGHKDDDAFHQALKNVVQVNNTQSVRSPSVEHSDSGYKVGDTIASLSFTTIDNKHLTLPFNSPRDHRTGLVFFGPWCEWYLEETKPEVSKACTEVRQLIERQSQTSTIQWLTISTNLWASIADLKDYRQNYQTTRPIIFDHDGELFKLFNVNQLPTVLLIDANGEITSKASIQDANFNAVLKSITQS
ncbi:TlpA family protein disulfide reductase [Thalassotalea fusca]